MTIKRIAMIIMIAVLIISAGINMLKISEFQHISDGEKVLDMLPAYTPRGASELFNKIGSDGREFYIVFLLGDFIFIISLAIIQSFLISRILKKITVDSKWQKIKYLAYIRGFFDVSENILILIILFNFPLSIPGLIIAASVMTVLKWISFIMIMAVMSVSSFLFIWKTFINRRIIMKKNIKVIGIISSPRKKGNTATLVREALQGAKEQGAEVTEVFLQDFSIAFCKGCLRCMNTGECVISDDIQKLKKIVAGADGMIIGSPNYASSFNAIMKQFLERIGMFEFLTSSLFGGKYAVGISTTGGSGADKVAKEMVNLFKNGIFQRGYVSGTYGVGVKGNHVSVMPEAMMQAKKLGEKLTKDIQKAKKYTFQNMFGRLVTKFALQPNFKKFIIRDRDTATKAVYQNLKLRELI